MLYTSIAFFALAAVLGMFLISFVLRGKETPKAVVFTHGPLAVIGLILLIVYSVKQPPRTRRGHRIVYYRSRRGPGNGMA